MWKHCLALAPGLAFALCAASASAQAALDRDALTAHGFEIASFQPADAFSGPPDESSFVHQPFRFARPLQESEEPRLIEYTGGWSYDRQTQTLRIGVSTTGWSPSELPGAEADDFMHYGLPVGSRNLSDQMTTAQSAYGAQFEVHSIEVQAVHVAPLTRRERAASVDIASNMFVDLPMAPEEARAAVTRAQVVVEGVLAPVEPGRMTLCYDTGMAATIDLRISTLIHICMMNARITRVAVVSGDGRTLTEWTATAGGGASGPVADSARR